jgi:hypothetical protein
MTETAECEIPVSQTSFSDEVIDVVKPASRFRTQPGRLLKYSTHWVVRYYVDDPEQFGKRVSTTQ